MNTSEKTQFPKDENMLPQRHGVSRYFGLFIQLRYAFNTLNFRKWYLHKMLDVEN